MNPRDERPLAVVALGGNALLPPDAPASIEAQRETARQAANAIAHLVGRYRLVITHGNGPQVGAIIARSEAAGDAAYPIPLDVAVAQSQGEIGYLLQQALADVLSTPVVPVLTRTVVDPDDPAFETPTKPIGPGLDAAHVSALEEQGTALDRGEGHRRLVPSPEPQRFLEIDAIETLVEQGIPVIAAGGGGIPVVEEAGRYRGVEAIVDKDLASALLARTLDADAFLLATDVGRVHTDHGTSTEQDVEVLTVDEARRGLEEGQFPPGSMGPKIEAAIRVLEQRPDMRVIIGSLEELPEGTRVTPV